MKLEELSALYHQPLFDLISQSRAVHLEHWAGEEVQRCSLLSIKTGGCSEDCAYCAQSAHYSTGIEREELLSIERIVDVAKRARGQGATRFCMGAAWRGVRDGTDKFERVLEIVRDVSRLGMEVCVTLGEIGPAEARKLKAAGVPRGAIAFRARARRSGFLPGEIRFFLVTNFSPRITRPRMSILHCYVSWDSRLKLQSVFVKRRRNKVGL